MRASTSLARRLGAYAVAFVLGAAFVGTAWAAVTNISGNLKVSGTVTASNFKYKSPKVSKLVVPGSAFIPDDNTLSYSQTNYSGAFEMSSGAANGAVYLPHGARVKKVQVFHDTGSADRVDVHLESSFPNPNGGHDDMADFANKACASTPCVSTDGTISPSVVNNNKRHYGIYLSFNSAITIGKVVIIYETGDVGPRSAAPGWASTGAPSRH